MKQAPEHKFERQFRKGVLAGLCAHLAGVLFLLLLAFLIGELALAFVLLFFGVAQFFYFIPALIVAKRKQATNDFIKGMALTCAIPFIMNAGCFGIWGLGSMGR